MSVASTGRRYPGRVLSEEHRARISAALRGKVVSDAAKAKISASNTGRRRTEESRAKMRARAIGNRSHWKGDAVGYEAIHLRVRRGDECERCSATERVLHRAFNHDTPNEFVRYRADGLPYSVRAEDYMTLCVPCHKKYDLSATR